jgi:predicted metal-dependent HD superfamily phosphohydrolase
MASPAVDNIVGLDRFQDLWRRCLIDGERDDSASIHQRLISSYCEPQRHYHTLAHVEHCLGMFDQCKSLVSNPDALELAIWFHDVIFEPGRHDNEALSKELYLYLSIKVHAPELRELVGRLIMATLHDGSSLEDDDARYMVDIDLTFRIISWAENVFTFLIFLASAMNHRHVTTWPVILSVFASHPDQTLVFRRR